MRCCACVVDHLPGTEASAEQWRGQGLSRGTRWLAGIVDYGWGSDDWAGPGAGRMTEGAACGGLPGVWGAVAIVVTLAACTSPALSPATGSAAAARAATTAPAAVPGAPPAPV